MTSKIPLCRCLKPAVKRISKTENANKGRAFYRCALSGDDACNYFAWADGSKRPFLRSSSPAKDRDNLARAKYVIYTDGACQGNTSVSRHRWPCGWAAVILKRSSSSDALDLHDEIYGPLELEQSGDDYLGAQVTSNNTAELSAIGEALRWLQSEANDPATRIEGRIPVVIRFDSEYAANSVQGLYKSKKNVALITTIQQMLRDVVDRGFEISFIHVKGHSSERWNDRADELANFGATGKRKKYASKPIEATSSKRIRS